LPGFVKLLVVQPDIGRAKLPVWKFGYLVVTSALARFAPLLRRVVFIGEAALCARVDFQCVGLCAKGRGVTRPSSRDRRRTADYLQPLLAGIA
jgi:hypothetical protein